MILLLLLLFTVVPVLELAVLIKVGTQLGVLNTILLTVGISVIGAWLARFQGFLVLRKVQANLQQGILPTEEMYDGVLILFGGLLLLTPGFISDTFGLILLFPVTRSFMKYFLRKKIETMLQNGEIVSLTSFPRGAQRKYDDIDLN